MAALRKYLLAGIVALTPILVTVALIDWLIGISDQAVALLPKQYQPEVLLGINVPGLGIILALLAIIVIGAVTTHFIGNWVIRLIDRIMGRIPLVRTVYNATRQLLESIFSDHAAAFRDVVMVPFPNPESMVIGFVTGEGPMPVQGDDESRLSVFIPSTPIPTTGWLLFVKASDVQFLDMSVEEGMKLVLSGGMLPASTGGKDE
ncbi:hypothetical protein MMIC_P1057 [Mariprofundus micogutta]|uniref:DUF502 domain-containing protein n=1 Tax=Mariprofundus micogutta TaxID=1921010 RepID=A0A1L8CMG4_9PROT|nr:DUF502 domain-containing protein [Mariprofundus micogutta]GAV20095.1 hypothetical protein MMIC_P1057 [Mariprofundus micogutta]